MSLYADLKGRWKPEYESRPNLAAVRRHLHRALDVAAMLDGKRSSLAADPRQSDQGRQESLKEFAATEAGRIGEANRALQHAWRILEQGQKALVPSVTNKTDVAAALLRREIREALKGRASGEITKLASAPATDTMVLEALWEGPEFITNVTPNMRANILRAIIERDPRSKPLALENEGLELVAQAVRVGAEALQRATGLNDTGFESWMTERCPIDPAEAAAEAAAFDAQHLTETAKRLPFNQRHSLVESLLAANSDELAGTAKAA
jgi:hypothetical protein